MQCSATRCWCLENNADGTNDETQAILGSFDLSTDAWNYEETKVILGTLGCQTLSWMTLGTKASWWWSVPALWLRICSVVSSRQFHLRQSKVKLTRRFNSHFGSEFGMGKTSTKTFIFCSFRELISLEPTQGDSLWLLPGSQDVLVHQLVLIMIKIILFIYLVHFSVEYLLDT